jgi:carboxylesterase type B
MLHPCGRLGVKAGKDFRIFYRDQAPKISTHRGNPHFEGLPFWPAYHTEKRATMLFDVPCRVENDPRKEERLVWNEKPVSMW